MGCRLCLRANSVTPLQGLDVGWLFFTQGFTLGYLSHAPAGLMHPKSLKGLNLFCFFSQGFTPGYFNHASAGLMHPNPFKGLDVVWFFLPRASPCAI
jgi:hypothetical protein